MRVLVTGGTGFVGIHTVVALLEAGHDVKLLVRSPERVRASYEPLGVVRDLEAVAGDVTEPDTVERAIEGCDAALHGASVFTLDASKGDLMRRVNVAGTERRRRIDDDGWQPVLRHHRLHHTLPDDFAALIGDRKSVV